MHVLINSFLLVLASEMGDKTQLLALVLASRFRKPWTILAAVLVATALNHFLASWLGRWGASFIPHAMLVWLLAATFFVFAIWVLIPDKESDVKASGHFGAFLTTLIAFFLAEMGDKTQLATVALGARYNDPVLVTIGTTAGMMVSNALAVFFGERLTRRIPMRWIHRAASLLFALFGVLILLTF